MKPDKLLPFQLFAACLVGLILGKFCFSTTKDKVELSLFNGKPSKLQSVMNIIENRYVDILDIDSLTELAIPDVLGHLDPHTAYTPAQRRNESEKNITGKFCGVGIEFNAFNDTVQILYTNPGGPAHKAGARPGDRIIAIDTISIVGPQAKQYASRLLKGERLSEVDITVYRQRGDTTLNLHIVRDNIKVRSVPASYVMDSVTAYLKIQSFGDSVHNEFVEHVRQLKEHGIQSLVIDLRNNGGGRVEQVRRIISEILYEGDTIAFTINRKGQIEEMYIDTVKNGLCRQMRIACLVNSNSASASEIMSGAIQDNDRGVIVGRRTFGKGLVQTPIELNDGSVVKLTTYRYYTPSGRSLQKGYDEYENDLQRRRDNGELDSASAYQAKDSMQYLTRNGRVVYSKGGVSPDLFVPEQTKISTRISRQMDSASICYRYAARKYAEAIVEDTVPNGLYVSALLVNDKKTIDELMDMARQQGIEINARRDKKEIELMRGRWLNEVAAFSYHILGNENETARYSNMGDTDIEQAAATINNDTLLNEILNKETAQ